MLTFTSYYRLAPHRPKRLAVTRNVTWSEVIVRLDGSELFRTDDERLVQGEEYTLRDGSVLRIWLEYGPRRTRFLHLTLNGRPLPGSEGDPKKILRDTLLFVGFVAVVQIAFALLMIDVGDGGLLTRIMLGAGAILLLLSWLAWRRSVAAMVFASIITVAETAVFFYNLTDGRPGALVGLLFPFAVAVWFVWRGIKAIQDLNATALPVRRPAG